MAKKSSSPEAASLLRELTRERAEMVAVLREFVECESPSTDRDAVNELGATVSRHFDVLGARTRVHKFSSSGNAFQFDFGSPTRAPRVLLLGHLDTVYELGALRTMPWHEKAGKLYGPGAFDMKAGIVQAIFALQALLARGPLPCPVTVFLVPDEEIGSPHSRAITEKLAKECGAVFVLEPAAGPHGACKVGRKGNGVYTLRVHGVPAHAGLDFTKGASAILELSNQIARISKLSNPARGLTINPGLIRGGTRPNVVAADAQAQIDVRVLTKAQARTIDTQLHRLRPLDRRCKLELTGGMNRPPFERNSATMALYKRAAACASELGFTLQHAIVGGASDGNHTSALGIPTLDGLGAVGDGAHSSEEYVLAAELPRRAALLACLLATIS
jgi:glutamate carboxypeptidase